MFKFENAGKTDFSAKNDKIEAFRVALVELDHKHAESVSESARMKDRARAIKALTATMKPGESYAFDFEAENCAEKAKEINKQWKSTLNGAVDSWVPMVVTKAPTTETYIDCCAQFIKACGFEPGKETCEKMVKACGKKLCNGKAFYQTGKMAQNLSPKKVRTMLFAMVHDAVIEYVPHAYFDYVPEKWDK